jgi:hypothetical protein
MNFTQLLHRNLNQLERMKRRAVKGLHTTLRKIEAEKKKRTADLEDAAKAIYKELHQWGMGTGKTKPKTKTAAKARKRQRRSPKQLKKYADGVFQFVKAHPGSGGGEIRKAFKDVGQNIAGFVSRYSSGYKLRTVGKKSKMRYHAS